MFRKARIWISSLLIFLLVLGLIPGMDKLSEDILGLKKARAATIEVYPLAMYHSQTTSTIVWQATGQQTQTVSTYFHDDSGALYDPAVRVDFSVSIPANVVVTNARVYLKAHVYYPYEGYHYYTGYFWGNTFPNLQHTGTRQWIQSENIASRITPGSTTTVSYTSIPTAQHKTHGYKGLVVCQYDTHLSGNRPYLVITYEYAPSTPSISSPVAGSKHMDSINLSASSSVTGGGTITYYWEYSTNGSSWLNIGNTTTILNWSIPGSITEGSTVYLRTRALANGVYSQYSTPITFIKGVDDLEAAKLAAEAALVAANEASVRAQTAINQTMYEGQSVGYLAYIAKISADSATANSVTAALNALAAVEKANEARDTAVSVERKVESIQASFIELSWTNNKSATNTAQEYLTITNYTPGIEYRYKVNNGGYSAWQPLTDQVLINIGAENGYKQVYFQLGINEEVLSTKTKCIWKL